MMVHAGAKMAPFFAATDSPGEVQIIDHNRERELAEIVAIHFEFFQCPAKFADLGLFRVIDEDVVSAGRGIRGVEIAHERALGGVVVAPARMDQTVRLVGGLFFHSVAMKKLAGISSSRWKISGKLVAEGSASVSAFR